MFAGNGISNDGHVSGYGALPGVFVSRGATSTSRLTRPLVTARPVLPPLPPPMPRPSGPILTETPVMAQDDSGATPDARAFESKTLWYVGAAALIAAVGGVAYWFATRKSA
jgi:hypothetical protein